MRALFFVADGVWNGSARAFVIAARGLTERGHQITFAAPAESAVLGHAQALGIECVPAAGDATAAGGVWWLRRVLQERFVEAVFVHSEREQLMVSSAMRLAERGAVIRRVPALSSIALDAGRVAPRLAATGVIVTTDEELKALEGARATRALKLPTIVVPLGVHPAAYEGLAPAPRGAGAIPEGALLVTCAYDATARIRVATAMRTLALLRPRHPTMHLAIVGPNARDEDLRMHAAALDIGGAVSFHEPPAGDLSLIRAADVGWIAASGDDGAFAILDCMAMRIPVLAERGPLPQHYVADGITGVLLSPGAPSAVAAAVAAFLAPADRRAAMGNAGHARVQRDFPEDAMIDGFEQALAGAADRTRWAVR